MKKMKTLLKSTLVYLSIFSLIQTSMVFEVSANQTMNEVGGAVIGVLQTVSAAKNQAAQQQKNLMLQQLSQQKIGQLSPSCRNADGTLCYSVQGKFFPECMLPPSMSNMPENACSTASPNPQDLQNMLTYEAVAKNWVNHYSQMLNEASNEAYPTGLKCLETQSKKMDAQFVEMMNNLTRLQDQLKKDKETFEANNKRLLDEMTLANQELLGANSGKGINNIDAKTNSFARFFSASCQTVIGNENIQNGASLGLNGILASLQGKNKAAADYNSNRTIIEKEIRADVEKIQAKINQGGLKDFISQSSSGKLPINTKYASLTAANAEKFGDFQTAFNRITTELNEISPTILPAGKNYSIDFDEYIAGAKTYFRKKYVNECVTGADNTGIAIPVETVLASLRQVSTNSGGTATSRYREALSNILNSDAFIEDKMAQIKALENTYKDITITYQNSSARRVTETPYQLYMKTITQCSTKYEQDDTFTANGSVGASAKRQMERGVALLNELKSLQDNYATSLSSNALDRILSCNGETKKAGTTCSEDSFNYSSPAFCMAQVDQCANEVLGCYSEANKQVEARKAKMKNLAVAYNKNMTEMVNRSNMLYSQQKIAVTELIKNIQARFPGTNFPIPEDMFVAMPQMSSQTFGIDLLADGNLNVLDQLPAKIDLLKDMFAKQQDLVKGEISNYVATQAKAWSEQSSRWDQLANQCKSMYDTSAREIDKANREGLAKQNEVDNQVIGFCKKYDMMRSNPLGACNDIKKLAEEADKIQARVTDSALRYTYEFKNVCNMYNNESESVDSECLNLDGKTAEQKAYCKAVTAKAARNLASSSQEPKRNRVRFSQVCPSGDKPASDKDFFAAVAKRLSSEDQKILKDVTSFAEYDKVADKLDETAYDFFAQIKNLAATGAAQNKICENLTAINNAPAGKKEEIEAQYKKDIADLEKRIADEAKKPKEEQKPIDKTVETKKLDDAKSIALKKISLESTLAELATPVPTTQEIKAQQLARIGEQVDGSCDAQASNITSPKDFGTSLLNAFDQSILGGSGTRGK